VTTPTGFAHWREILRVVEDYAASTRAPVREHTLLERHLSQREWRPFLLTELVTADR
jgi:hypothetical protein